VEQNNNLQQRLLLALVLSFIVFVVFDMFMPKPVKTNDQNRTATTQTEQQTPSVVNLTPSTTTTSSPIQQSSSLAPVTTVKALTTISSDKFVYTIDELGRIAQVKLLEKKYEYEDKKLELLNPLWVKPLEIRFADAKLNKEALITHYTTSAPTVDLLNGVSKVVLTQKLTTTTVTKELTFYKDGHYDININLSEPAQYFITTGQRPNADHTMYMVVQGSLVKRTNGIIDILEDGDVEEKLEVQNAQFTSAFDRYFASILYNFEKPLKISTLIIGDEDALVFVQGEQNFTLHGYVGPKESAVLKKIHPELTDVIEYGLFTFISKPLFKVLEWFYDLTGNWGWAIVMVTLLIKLILFPLSYKGMMSMQRLKELAPQMKELKEKYGKDPQKMNAKMMEMYKKHGANPMGGCLPLLLQIPIFFAIYRVLLNAVELQGAEWTLWITNLSQMDPWFVLPILMGASMWYQQKITPNTMTDPMQQKIFQWLPVVMTVFFITFPAGLVLYWLVNNVFTIAQQYIINKAFEKQKANKLATQK
jgi:YidC/Oxa1 family membrane protein insertase